MIDNFAIISTRNNSTKYSLTNHDIKIGDNLEKLKDIFPLSYKKKRKTNIWLHIEDYDKYLDFSFNKDNKIKSMRVGSY